MSFDARAIALIDTSVLLNFLAVDRVDLLSRHPELRFVVTDHVRGEITDRRPEQLTRFEAAVTQRLISQSSVSTPRALELFGELQKMSQLGIGESAAAAAAIALDAPMATDDRRAAKIIGKLFPALVMLDTAQIVRELIKAGVLTVEEADTLKTEWELRHRFKLPFSSFAS